MLSDDELGDALRRELRDLGADLQPSAKLISGLEGIPGPQRRRRRERWIAVPAAALALAVVAVLVVLVLAGSNPPSASAITITSHGRTVQVTLAELEAITPANRKLAVLGHVRVVAMTAGCSTPTTGFNYAIVDDHPTPKIQYGSPPAGSDVTELIAARRYAPGKIDLVIGTVTGRAPACVSSKGTGPGFPGWHPTRRERLGP